MANTANSTLNTNFNVTPYYDDYDPKGNYYRILFQPGFAVQARELTQIQSMLQEQVNRFGQHVFKEGSKVLGSTATLDKKVPYVKVNDNDTDGAPVELNKFVNQFVTGLTSGIRAYVNLVEDGVQTSQNTKTLYVTYTNGNPITGDVTFIDNETLVSNVGSLVTVSANAVGHGSVLTLAEGVRFAKSHFIYHGPQALVVDKYATSPNCKVALFISEEIITADEDNSLLDPALESSNYSAPGADRFKLVPSLRKLDLNDVSGPPNFVNIIELRDGVITEINDRPTYNVIQDEISKRTYDESGDYYVRGLNVVVQEHLKQGDNLGYLTSGEGGNSSLLSVQVEPGLAYVKGYEINKLTTSFLTTEKSLDYANVNSQTTSAKLGSYITLNEFVGSVPLDSGATIELYDAAQTRISSQRWSTTAQSGNRIGTARIKSISYGSGSLGTPSGELNLHLFDVKMNGTNSFANVRSVYLNNASDADVGGDVVLTNGRCALKEPGTPLTYFVGKNSVRSIRSSDGNIDTFFTYKKSSGVSIAAATGTFTLTVSGEEFPYGASGTLSAADKNDIVLTLNQGANITLAGTTLSANGNVLTGSGTVFSRLNNGDKLEFSGNTRTYRVVSKTSNTVIQLDGNLPATIAGNSIFKAYKTGDIIDLNTTGANTGLTRTVTISSPTSLVFDLREVFPGSTISGTIAYNVKRTGAREIAKDLRADRYVKISCNVAGTTGPFNLGFSDVFRIKKIWKKASAFSTETTAGATDVTELFTFDNGQRDDFYDLASITPRSTAGLTASDHLLVQLDYFVPNFTQGAGYFSVDSYPVNDTNPTSSQITTAQIPSYVSKATGAVLNLRNMLDFRPVYASTATDSTTIVGGSTNPAAASTILSNGSGLRIPVESELISYDYSYYLGRIDVVTLEKDGDFVIVKGKPGATPVTPEVPAELMSCAKIFIPPYPSVSLDYAKVLGNINLGCRVNRTTNMRYTMRDIGVLDLRVKNLEQYVSLNLLERSAIDMKILDEDGLDRFKNGIFADTFTNGSLSDFANPDHHISYDSIEKSIRPLYESEALAYRTISNTNCQIITDYVMLPFEEVTLIDQPYATTIRNVETTVYRFVGKVYLNPETDFWVNTQRLQAQTIEIGDENTNVDPYSISYGAWSAWTGRAPGVYDINNGGAPSGSTNILAPGTSGRYGAWGTTSGSGINQLLGTASALGPDSYALAQNFVNSGDVSGYDAYATTNRSREVIETFNSVVTQNQSQGDKIVDVAPIADIRPQVISLHGTGLKSNTRYYVFFDGKLMSSYVTPATGTVAGIIPSGNNATNNAYTGEWPIANRGPIFTPSGSEGAALFSDGTGNVYGNLRLPADGSVTFRTGTKEVIITDSPTNEPDATSAAKGYFYAQGIQQTKQETIISTKTVVSETRRTTETQQGLIIYDAASCMAYSFLVKAPDGVEGIFLTSVDTFFQAKDPNLGIWFEIRAMDNAGNITRTAVPGSEVWMKSSDIKLSDDSSVPTNIKFKRPLFLENNKEYAFVIHTEGINPNYYMHVSVLGGTDKLTGNPVNQRGLTGTLYTTNNNLDWNMVDRVDLKVKFYRARFNTGVVGEVVLGTEPFEFLNANNMSAALTSVGERFVGNDRLTLTTPVGGSISVGNFLRGANSGVNSAVVAINGSTYTMANSGYAIGERVQVAGGSANSNVSAKSTATGFLYQYKDNYNMLRVRMAGSNGQFFAGDTLRGATSGQSFTVEGIDRFTYETTQFEPSYITFKLTDCSFDMRTTSNTGSLGAFEPILPSITNHLTDEKAILSRSAEVSTLSGTPSNQVRATMFTQNEYLSPVVDLAKTYSLFVHNLINANTSGETAKSGGGLTNKYISQIVTLAEGQDAEDLRIFLTAHRPPTSNSDVKVYVRFSNAEDFEPITERAWIEMEYLDNTVYSSLANRYNFIEYSFKVPDSSMTGLNDMSQPIVGYTNSAGTTFRSFRQYQIKIGLQSENAAVYPRVADLRAIALQK